MSKVNFSVHLLSGKPRRFSVKPDTPILPITEQLESEQNLPEFHKISLYVCETELIEGSISEVVLLETTEVQAVASASFEKPVKVIKEAHAELTESFQNESRRAGRHPQPLEFMEHVGRVHQKLAKAASFLLQLEDFSEFLLIVGRAWEAVSVAIYGDPANFCFS